MRHSARFFVVMALECMALLIGAYSLSFLNYHERSHVAVETSILCLLGGLVGTLVTRPKTQAVVSSSAIALGIVALGVGSYFLTTLEYHERAYIVLGSGIICLLGGIAGILVARSKVAAFTGVTALGVIALGVGGYFLTTLGYHGRAYIILGAGLLCLLGGIAGTFLTRSKAKAAVK